jgi:hypothetical protein
MERLQASGLPLIVVTGPYQQMKLEPLFDLAGAFEKLVRERQSKSGGLT